MSTEKVWFLGYGSNMDAQNLSEKKKVKVFDHTPAVLRGYKMEFSLNGVPYAEPFFANCSAGAPTDEIHGIAFQTDMESVAKLDAVESGYNKANVTYVAYDGRKLDGFVYVSKPSAKHRVDGNPSRRYLMLLVNGATAAGLDQKYIDRLKAHPVYVPDAECLARREAILKKDLPLKNLTAEDLGKDVNQFVSVYGVIFDVGSKAFFGSHRGFDITRRNIRHFLNLPLEGFDEDDGPQSYPDEKQLEKEHKEVYDYVWTWFDHYVHISNANAVARLKNYDSSQGNSAWKYPL